MSVEVREYLRTSKDRVTGTIMGYMERQPYWQTMSREQQLALRQCVLDALNVYHERMLDLMKSDNATRNDEVIDMLRRLDSHMTQQQRRARNPNERVG